MHHPSCERPARQRRPRSDPSGRDQLRHPPGIVPFDIDDFDRGIDDLELQRRRGSGPGRRRDPRGEEILDPASPAPHLDERLPSHQPHRPQIAAVDEQLEQATINDHPPCGSDRSAAAVDKHHIAVFDRSEPIPGGGPARDPAVDAGQRHRQRPVAQRRLHHRGRREPDRSADRRQDHRPAEGPAAPRGPVSLMRSGVSRRHEAEYRSAPLISRRSAFPPGREEIPQFLQVPWRVEVAEAP